MSTDHRWEGISTVSVAGRGVGVNSTAGAGQARSKSITPDCGAALHDIVQWVEYSSRPSVAVRLRVPYNWVTMWTTTRYSEASSTPKAVHWHSGDALHSSTEALTSFHRAYLRSLLCKVTHTCTITPTRIGPGWVPAKVVRD